MKSRYGRIIYVIACILLLHAIPATAGDQADDAALALLQNFMADRAARADYASRNPQARQAELQLQQFPPAVQKRIERVVLMILEESGSGASRHVEAAKASGPEGAFLSFSPAVQQEIAAIARELEKDPEFMKKTGAGK
jgi:hypothetical protein